MSECAYQKFIQAFPLPYGDRIIATVPYYSDTVTTDDFTATTCRILNLTDDADIAVRDSIKTDYQAEANNKLDDYYWTDGNLSLDDLFWAGNYIRTKIVFNDENLAVKNNQIWHFLNGLPTGSYWRICSFKSTQSATLGKRVVFVIANFPSTYTIPEATNIFSLEVTNYLLQVIYPTGTHSA